MNPASGKFVIRMPAALHMRLREEAARTRQSLNQLCVRKLQENVSVLGSPGGSQMQQGIVSCDLVAAIVNRWGAELVGLVLFGSAARGDATEASDIDLLLVMTPEAPISRACYRAWDEFCIEHSGAWDLDRVSAHFVHLPVDVRDAGGLWYEASLDGFILWDRGRQAMRFLGSVREAMGQGKIRRRMLHGSPYWIKNFEVSDA
jgi:predicted nucleotidyltransferase